MDDHHYRNQWIVEINNYLTNMPNPLKESSDWSKRSIYRIPSCVTDLNERAYRPQVVSFGPYHHGSITLLPMEEHKRRAMLHFLKRSKKPLQSFIDALTPVIEDLKAAYDHMEEIDDDDDFLELMIVDGCFLLEILRCTASETDQKATDQSDPNHDDDDDDYASNDPIFSHHGKLHIIPHLKRDMLMLENQLPMLVLEKLVSVLNDDQMPKMGKDLIKLILNFFSKKIPLKEEHVFANSPHILDFYRKTLFVEDQHFKNPTKKTKGNTSEQAGDEEIVRSATELNEAGITIKRSQTRSLKDISFSNGVLRLPLTVVDDTSESRYLNLIAFERFHVGAGNEVTSYIFFMDNIIDNERDVSLLHNCGIVQNALGSDKAVAKLFNSLSKDVTLDRKSDLGEVHKRVSAYCKKPQNQWRANLMHTYFTNPWAILSVVAAIFLFALTIVQTIYSVLGYVRPR